MLKEDENHHTLSVKASRVCSWFLHFQGGVYYGGSPKEHIIPLLHREKQDLSQIIHANYEQI